jgi:hypothetical protein
MLLKAKVDILKVCLKRLQHHPSPPNLRSTCGILNQCNYGTKRLGCAIWQLQNTRNRVVGVQLTRLTWLPRYRTVAHGLVIAVGSGGPTSGQHGGRVPPLPHHLATPLYYYQNHNQDLHTSHSHLQFQPPHLLLHISRSTSRTLPPRSSKKDQPRASITHPRFHRLAAALKSFGWNEPR